MYSYIMRRLAFGALTVIGVSIIVFIVLRILPGDPVVAIFGADGFTKLTEAERAHYMAELGLSRRPVIRLHALPNALLPVITLSGVLLGFVLAGSIPVERAFGTPGLGYAMFTAVSERDVFVMQNLVFLYACVFVVLNILVDLTIAWLDPRIRYQ